METVEPVADLVRAKTRLLVAAVLSLVCAFVAAGCETTSTVSTGPTPVKCQVSVAALVTHPAGYETDTPW